jgi:hypothetical protein
MPFHVGGHKPQYQRKRVVGIKDRLLVSMAGSLLVFGGVFRIEHGAAYVLNWWSEPVYAWGLIIAGVIVIPLAWIPARWSDRVVAWAERMTRDEPN